MTDAGEQILKLARSAQHEVVLAAPFVKVGALRRIVNEIPNNVRMRLYTRWRPDEIVAGVSDIEAWQVIRARQFAAMYLCHHLHAKCYIFDNEASVGSANITASALGWHTDPNLEIQVRVPASSKQVVKLLKELERNATVVNDELVARFEALALELAELKGGSDDEAEADHVSNADWLPWTRQPTDLFLAYQGRIDEISRGTQAAAIRDLRYLGIPLGLSLELFESCVATVLEQHQLFEKVHTLATKRRRFGVYRQLVREYLVQRGSDRDPADAWQTCLRWLLHFCADSYEIDTPKYTEILTLNRS